MNNTQVKYLELIAGSIARDNGVDESELYNLLEGTINNFLEEQGA